MEKLTNSTAFQQRNCTSPAPLSSFEEKITTNNWIKPLFLKIRNIKEIENPYFGEMMLSCGETRETLKY
jgi:hypothetical protein